MLKKNIKLINFFLIASLSLLLTGCHGGNNGVLNPKGVIAFEERQLLFDAIALMLIVVIPVVIMSFAFMVRYRQAHRTSDYRPNWAHNSLLEAIWWGVPCVIIVILGIMTWRMTHKLDPFTKIAVPGQILQIEAVALPWKWLFIYPKQNIATVNYVELPKDKQVQFLLTNDNVPMSAFFIPQLGSQVYSMAGMRTRLHLIATSTGTFEGLNSQYNGNGFSEMHFKAKVVDQKELERWYQQVKRTGKSLNTANYRKIRQPSAAAPVEYFSSVAPDLFKNIIKSYQSAERP